MRAVQLAKPVSGLAWDVTSAGPTEVSWVLRTLEMPGLEYRLVAGANIPARARALVLIFELARRPVKHRVE